MNPMNNFVGVGRITRDFEIQTSASGTSYGKNTLAINRNRKNGNGEYEADFIPFAVFGKTAEFAEKYFKKGDPIAICGELQSSQYTDKDGNKRTGYEIIAGNIGFVPASKKSENTDSAVSENPFSNKSEPVDEELPF